MASPACPVSSPIKMLDDEIQGFTADELNHFKHKLLMKRMEIQREARATIHSEKMQLDVNELKDEFDLASVTTQQDLTFRMLDRCRKLLKEIDHALKKMDSGDFGYCEGTGEQIPKRRLELSPWVRHSVEHKEELERRKKASLAVKREIAFMRAQEEDITA